MADRQTSSQRGSSRGSGRGNNRGGNRGGNANRGGAARGGGANSGGADRPKKEAILDLAKYVDKKIRVKFMGGREVLGVLKGYDQIMNLVMDEVEETIRDPTTGEPTDRTRALGLTVLRGTSITVINPADGFEQIENPFAAPE